MYFDRTGKIVQIVAPGVGVDNTSFTTASVDTKGYRTCTVAVLLGNVPANLAALKVQESDDDGDEDAYTDITGTVVGTATDIDGAATALPTAAGGDNDVILFDIDLRGRKRYLDLVVTAGNGSGTATGLAAVAILGRAEQGNYDAASRGAASVLRS